MRKSTNHWEYITPLVVGIIAYASTIVLNVQSSVSSSHRQTTDSLTPLFSLLLARALLRNHMHSYMILAVLVTWLAGGIALQAWNAGNSSIVSDYNTGFSIFQTCVEIVSRFLRACQFVAEDAMIHQSMKEGSLVTCIEGTYALVFSVLWEIIVNYVPLYVNGESKGVFENWNEIYFAFKSKAVGISSVTTMLIFYVLLYIPYSWGTITLTRRSDCVTRALWLATIPTFQRLLGLLIHYLFAQDTTIGEFWSSYSWLVIGAGMFSIWSTFVFRAKIKYTSFYYPPPRSIKPGIPRLVKELLKLKKRQNEGKKQFKNNKNDKKD